MMNEDNPEEEERTHLNHEDYTAENGNIESDRKPLKKQASVRIEPRVFKRRWFMCFLFASYSFSNAYQWIHLNIIGDVIKAYYNESLPTSEYRKQVTIDWLSMIYMLCYIPLIFPSTWLLDKKGLRLIGMIGTGLNVLGACLKCFSVGPDRFAVLMAAQTTCAIAQVFILGIPARLAAVWFGPNEVATATSIGVFGNQLGVAVGFLIPPQLVPMSDDLDEIGRNLSIMFYGTAAVTALLFILVIIAFKNGPPVPPSQAQAAIVEAAKNEDYISSIKSFFSNKGFLLLMVTYGVNTGCYYAVGTLLNPIILHYFPAANKDTGLIGLTLVVAGLGGSVIAGIWLDKTKWFKASTVGIYFMSFGGMVVLTFTLGLNKIWLVYLCAGILGFFMTGYLPVGFEFAAELTYPESEGTSSGLLNAAAQSFGIVFTLSMGLLINTVSVQAANIAVSCALLLGTGATVLIRSDLRRQRAGQQISDYLLDEKKMLEEGHKPVTT